MQINIYIFIVLWMYSWRIWQLFSNLLKDLKIWIKILINSFVKVFSIQKNNCYANGNFSFLVLVCRVFNYELAHYFFFEISLACAVNDGSFLACSICGICFKVQFLRHVDKILSFPILLSDFKCHIHLFFNCSENNGVGPCKWKVCFNESVYEYTEVNFIILILIIIWECFLYLLY